jgi:hypothetical protein
MYRTSSLRGILTEPSSRMAAKRPALIRDRSVDRSIPKTLHASAIEKYLSSSLLACIAQSFAFGVVRAEKMPLSGGVPGS